jgi:hypothetical protein
MERPSSRTGASTVSKTRWAAYSAASAATLLAGVPAAKGEIHYSGPLNIKVPPNGNHHISLPLDQRGDSIVFEHLHSTLGIFQQFVGFKAEGRVSASFRSSSGFDYIFVDRLERSDFVSAGSFNKGRDYLNYFGTMAWRYYGPFFARGSGYVGFAFNGGAGKQYGWVRLIMAGGLRGNAFKIVDYAYADPGEPIQAGQTRSTHEKESPALGSLGLLAAGASGLLLWRKHRRQENSPQQE